MILDFDQKGVLGQDYFKKGVKKNRKGGSDTRGIQEGEGWKINCQNFQAVLEMISNFAELAKEIADILCLW